MDQDLLKDIARYGKVVVWLVGLLLTWLAYRHGETWWGRIALREFGLKRTQYESEADFQWRRGIVWLWITALLVCLSRLSVADG